MRSIVSVSFMTLGMTTLLGGCLDDPAQVDAKGAIPIEPARFHEYGGLQRVQLAEPLSDADLDHEIELRRQYGLSTDRERVRALHGDPRQFAAVRSHTDMFGSLLLGQDEVAAAVERAEVEYHGSEADLWAQRTLGDRYAGSFVEGTHIVLQCAGCDPHALRSDVDGAGLHEVLRGRVMVRPVTYSGRELDEREARVAAYLQAHGIPSNGTTTDIVHNTVRLFVGPASEAAIDRELENIQRVAGGPLEIEHGAGDTSRDLDKDDAIAFLLVEGGQVIGKTPAGQDCTSGFAVQNGFGPFIMTAGHCGGVNQAWFQGGAQLGVAAATQDSGSFDAALITTFNFRNNWGRIHVDSTDWSHPVTFGVSTQSLINQTVCTSGFVTTGLDGLANPSTRCGVVSSLTFRPSGPYDAAFGVANYRRNHGDSGAGVYWPTGFGFGAAGLHSRGIAEAPTPGVFSRFSVIASAWGLQMSPFQ
jgi:hypothetical protein